ncbi:MAG: secondary thiamine-phosphate synthase enzyme YjbQ [Candidatus Thermoplasmatota archaeon]|nr:secondary thiamine-phosphate synthase enzyme YjbQ [Candidatus Thermoplasmatota archaeon]
MQVIEFQIRTRQHNEMIDITAEVESIVEKSGTANGICLVFCPHTTAGLTINENADPSVRRDILTELSKIVPENDPDYSHSEGNSAAHVKASLISSSVQIIIENGRLLLGTWQGIYFCEFDGPRERKILMKIIEG